MSRTTKPCPGCGVVHSRRSSAEVCHECRAVFVSHKILVESLEAAIDAGDLEPVRLYGASHWQPYIGPESDHVNRLFMDLCHAVSVRTWRDGEWHTERDIIDRENKAVVKSDRSANGSPSQQYLMPAGACKTFGNLHESIRTLVDHSYLRGHEKGRDLLMSLHSGDITLAEFEDRALRTDEHYGD